ncbi:MULTISPECIES: DUF924 family protein [Legionella]|uniref:DUF924 family protein n=1 Tax=Legionella TaxID=445 RepID=UPI0009622FEA|nr:MULTISPECIES: DUF924 family protein [Legionella]MBN9228588.1 DUF924 domain-containing protein [Legionella steelei]OJW08097.1 MAG: hypothetical protein BGO44_12425 [Legionella sp. 39-23]
MAQSKIETILSFWFGDSFEDEFPPRSISDRWYSFHPNLDSFIRKEFLNDIENALAGQYDDWSNTPEGRLALIILLDQFTRHVYRNTSKAFAGDQKALSLVYQSCHIPMGANLLVCQKMFYFAPLEHSEKLNDQKLHRNIYEDLVKKLPNNIISKLEYYLYWFNVHFEVIDNFGRFPWRNDLLGRKTTKKEMDYLKNSPNFGQNYKPQNT